MGRDLTILDPAKCADERLRGLVFGLFNVLGAIWREIQKDRLAPRAALAAVPNGVSLQMKSSTFAPPSHVPIRIPDYALPSVTERLVREPELHSVS
jgi:hypothetical protein